jgi:hypothetical protein
MPRERARTDPLFVPLSSYGRNITRIMLKHNALVPSPQPGIGKVRPASTPDIWRWKRTDLAWCTGNSRNHAGGSGLGVLRACVPGLDVGSTQAVGRTFQTGDEAPKATEQPSATSGHRASTALRIGGLCLWTLTGPDS